VASIAETMAVADDGHAGELHQIRASQQPCQQFRADACRIAHGDADSGDRTRHPIPPTAILAAALEPNIASRLGREQSFTPQPRDCLLRAAFRSSSPYKFRGEPS